MAESVREVPEGGALRARRVSLADGRYLIFYTFGEGGGSPDGAEGAGAARPEPAAEPSAEEERSV